MFGEEWIPDSHFMFYIDSVNKETIHRMNAAYQIRRFDDSIKNDF